MAVEGDGATAAASPPEGAAVGSASISADGVVTAISGGGIHGIATEVISSVYARRQDMVARFGETEILQLTDRTNRGEIDDSALSQALRDADAEIDSYLVGRYLMPLPSVPRVLRLYACDIARYRLYDDRVTDAVTSRYKQAVSALRQIADRRITLDLPATEADVAVPVGGPSADTADRVFTRDSLRDFIP